MRESNPNYVIVHIGTNDLFIDKSIQNWNYPKGLKQKIDVLLHLVAIVPFNDKWNSKVGNDNYYLHMWKCKNTFYWSFYLNKSQTTFK